MEAIMFAKMMSDPAITDFKKLHYKYPNVDMNEFTALLKETVYKKVPLFDFNGEHIAYLDNVTRVQMKSVKLLLTQQEGTAYGLRAMGDEIAASMEIEGIRTSRENVRHILTGYAPRNESEEKIYGMKLGLDFIADPANKITEENIYRLYEIAIAKYVDAEDQLLPGHKYRHDAVYVVGDQLAHTGLPHEKLPEYMNRLVAFIQEASEMDDLVKAAIIHFYVAFLHPYFDGNGRMARLIHLWYLAQAGFSSALFTPFSTLIKNSKNAYYKAYTLVEDNAKVSGVIDVTPFLAYFVKAVYNQVELTVPEAAANNSFQEILKSGQVTEKEAGLWNYVLSAYGTAPFSTKQLEKDYGDAAYATIRSFVLKFEQMGLLKSQKYGNRVKYSVSE